MPSFLPTPPDFTTNITILELWTFRGRWELIFLRAGHPWTARAAALGVAKRYVASLARLSAPAGGAPAQPQLAPQQLPCALALLPGA